MGCGTGDVVNGLDEVGTEHKVFFLGSMLGRFGLVTAVLVSHSVGRTGGVEHRIRVHIEST